MTLDAFETWDAAYVLGTLDPAQRRAFEEHLRGCERCAAAVAELAGMPGLLGRVPREQAFALLDAGAAPEPAEGVDVLPSLLRTVRRRRARTRWLIGAVAAVTAAVLVGVLAVALPSLRSTEAAPDMSVAMQQLEPSALTADLRLTTESWGTRVESRCRYARVSGDAGGRTWTYALVVTDRAGRQTQISTWTASEGSTVEPVATTGVPLGDIAAIDIRSAGTVLLRSTFG